MSVFKDAKLTLITDDGTELNADVTPERRRAGLSVSAQGNRSLCNAMAMHC